MNSLHSHPFVSSVGSSLELLTPDDVAQKNNSLELEDDDSEPSNESNDDGGLSYIDTGRTSSLFNIAEPPSSHRHMMTDEVKQFNTLSVTDSDNEDDYMALRQLVLYGSGDDDVTVTSDEEHDIINEIRAEVTANVQAEMKGELDIYRNPKQLSTDDSNKAPTDELPGMDPKLKEAILRMRKLDRILEKKIMQERKVKHERIMLSRRLQVELQLLHSDGKESSVEEKKNTEKFLALTLPASHNAGIRLDDVSSTSCNTPLFQTQPLDMDYANDSYDQTKPASASSSRSGTASNGYASPSKSSSATSFGSRMTGSDAGAEKKRKLAKNKKQKNKDFVRRNIELAADAQSMIAMTDDEKKRVEDLLADLDFLPDVNTENTANVKNPYQLAAFKHHNEGFLPSIDEQQRLEEIENRLQLFVPMEHCASVNRTPAAVNGTEQPVSPGHGSLCSFQAMTATDLELIGEQALKATKDDRDMKVRLKEIEDELNRLSAAETELTKLSDEQLHELLEDCARSLSRASDVDERQSSRSSSSCLALVYENPPHLDSSVLQQLLGQARGPLNDSGHLSSSSETLADDDVEHAKTSDRTLNPRRHSLPRTAEPTGSSDPRPGPLLSRLKSSNALRRSADESDRSLTARRHFLPSIDMTGSVSTQRPASDTRLNSDARHGSDGQTSSHRALTVNVWNSLPLTSSSSSTSVRGTRSQETEIRHGAASMGSGRRSASSLSTKTDGVVEH